MEFDLGAELGAKETSYTQRLTLYIPNKDKNDRKIKNYDRWVTEARELLTRIGGGATTFPPADGSWANEEGETIFEMTRMIFCYVYPDRFIANVKQLREFLHRFGRETNQGEVVVEFDNKFYRITDFDPKASI